MPTLAAALRRNVEQAGTRAAVIEASGPRSWALTVERIARAAGWLATLGIRRGDPFGVVARNGPRCFELMHAGYWLGAVPVPINHRLAPVEIAAVIAHAGCRWVAADAAFAEPFRHPDLAGLGVRLAGLDGTDPSFACTFDEGVPAASPIDPADVGEDSVALLLYTGGTTGRGKAVPLTHRNVIANALQVTSWLHFAADDVWLHVAPMFHSADLLATGVTLQGGAHAFLPQFTPTAWFDAVAWSGATRTMLAPAMIAAVLDHPSVRERRVPTLRQLVYGSSPMTPESIARTMARFDGVSLVQGYGLTETSPLLTMLTDEAHAAGLRDPSSGLLGSAGRALPGVELLIADAERRPLPPGTPGEVWVRGPNVTKGYRAASADEARAFDGDWFRTGDVGRLDGAGYLTLLDRSKDMIVTGGENVYSIEVERVLLQHPAVAEAAVVGVPDAKWGEALLAVVVCRPGTTLEAADMVEHCRGRLGGYKIPRRLRIVSELPRNALGKVVKARLRELDP
jgi:long-chain acyl-CoA synthetase